MSLLEGLQDVAEALREGAYIHAQQDLESLVCMANDQTIRQWLVNAITSASVGDCSTALTYVSAAIRKLGG
ncbi:hypothetical protein AVV29_gp056 [Vibrio phage phi 3]|uniref:Uncharacterized protein n=1 Tax=Vibrio phage phi 3 TaxID=1589298 RepID=A0A0B5H354_9CAUD|nr:hypothetical protein AVV29_gp010 [Vibrio phage phi 3]YP_009207620.1 hypothetical protein AVV29_gp056 [Vibrio phage phi 3]AJF40778.1 hypothetical protein SBVP3_0010 [Vibrio phage phi 3]AJF40922.1 hypothetical protein SBVP3_00155 [Vibrio phage phi 3]